MASASGMGRLYPTCRLIDAGTWLLVRSANCEGPGNGCVTAMTRLTCRCARSGRLPLRAASSGAFVRFGSMTVLGRCLPGILWPCAREDSSKISLSRDGWRKSSDSRKSLLLAKCLSCGRQLRTAKRAASNWCCPATMRHHDGMDWRFRPFTSRAIRWSESSTLYCVTTDRGFRPWLESDVLIGGRLVPRGSCRNCKLRRRPLRRWGTKIAVAVDMPFFNAIGCISTNPSHDVNEGDVI